MMRTEFGRTASGQIAHRYTLLNASGMIAQLTDWGATLVSLTLPHEHDGSPSVVLGAGGLGSYTPGFPAAATIGRFANRIALARFTLDGTEYRLPANDGPHHLHGGPEGFDQRLWSTEPIVGGAAEDAVRFRYRSSDREQGYPGNLDVRVTYSLTDAGELRIEYSAETDRPTPVNLTNHAYFNLAGRGDVLAHELWVDADSYTPINGDKIPTGEIATVAGTPFDFRSPRLIGTRIASLLKDVGGYDHNLVLRPGRDTRVPCARLAHPGSGLMLELFTSEPGIQLYTGNHLNHLGGAGASYPRHGGVCLETQHFPDSPNQPHFPSAIVRPGEHWTSTTTWRFRRVGG